MQVGYVKGTTTTQLLLHRLYPFFFPQYLYLAVSSLLLPLTLSMVVLLFVLQQSWLVGRCEVRSRSSWQSGNNVI